MPDGLSRAGWTKDMERLFGKEANSQEMVEADHMINMKMGEK